MATELVHALSHSATRLAELDHAGLKIVERTFYQTVLVFVVRQQVMPKMVLQHTILACENVQVMIGTHLAQDFGVAQNNATVLGSGQRDVQPSGVIEETNALMLIATDTADDDVVLLSPLECIHASDFNFLV